MKTSRLHPLVKNTIKMTTLLFLTGILFSCKKDASRAALSKNKLDEAVAILGGKMLSGNLTGNNSKEALILNFNNGQQYIFLEKIPGTDLTVTAGSYSAELITSTYGVVINDVVHNQTLFFVNNDQGSLAKMGAVKSLLNSNSEISKVFGVTTINVRRARKK